MPKREQPGPIAVVDVETTGLFPFRHDRVVEVAVVVVHSDGRVEREFSSLVNPGRDMGPSSIHGLTAEDVMDAPTFADIASPLIEAMKGSVGIAGHNVRFDRQFLEFEFSRIGSTFPQCHSICTMQLAGGGRLTDCCADYAIEQEGEAHQALADARSASRLLCSLLADLPRSVQELTVQDPIRWPDVPSGGLAPLTRSDARRRRAEPSTFLQRLLQKAHDSPLSNEADGAALAYGALLDRALEDRRVDPTEADALVEAAKRWGLAGDQIRAAHGAYLNNLVIAALADGMVTDIERNDLLTVARLLGQARSDLENTLTKAAARLAECKTARPRSSDDGASMTGKRVCFTGEMQATYRGNRLSRELAEELAISKGLEVQDSVTKSLDVLVVADPHTQSGKAKKAQKYGIRVLHEPVFWKALGLEVA